MYGFAVLYAACLHSLNHLSFQSVGLIIGQRMNEASLLLGLHKTRRQEMSSPVQGAFAKSAGLTKATESVAV